MKPKRLFKNLILYFAVPMTAYANTQISDKFDSAFKQWAIDNKWGTSICKLSTEDINIMYLEYVNANKIISSVGTKCTVKSKQITTQTEQASQTTDTTTNEIQLAEMSTPDACKYWNGTFTSDNTCAGTSGMLWIAQWNDNTKSFSCILKVVDIQQNHPDQTKLINMYRDATYDSSGQPYDFVSDLQWNKDLQKCTSALERQCINDGNTYDYSDNLCLSHKYDQEKCKSVGGIFSETNGKSNCDCTIGDKSFHWDSDGTCEYTSGNYSKSNTKIFESDNSKYAEYCIYRQLIQTDLFNGSVSKLNCTNK